MYDFVIKLAGELILLLSIFGVIFEWVKANRRNSVILIDFDTLANSEAIINRAAIWVQNNPNKNFYDYFKAHACEQEVIPNGVLKALKYQKAGYTLAFMSIRDEQVRIETAKLLNDWQLKGELYMNNGYINAECFKNAVLNEIKYRAKKRVIGVIDNCSSHLGLYSRHGIKVI